jgi:serine phosphatase RsbU (regulator of sigma subunit)
MSPLDLGRAIRSAFEAEPGAVPDVVLQVAETFGATDVATYLVDFSQRTLSALPCGDGRRALPPSEDITTTMAGKAFIDGAPVVAERDEDARIWVPIVEGSDRTGVLGVTVPAATPDVVARCEELGRFAGYLIATHARATDLYHLGRRRRPLSVGATMQWDLLPPLQLKTARVAVVGLLEPAYDVGGDCFDYALNGAVLDVAIFDPVGHGLGSALIAALCAGTYRHDRRDGLDLPSAHRNLDLAITQQLRDAFSTGQLLRLDVETGLLSWTNAGHPLPLLVRGGRVVKELACPPTLPWGMGLLHDEEVVVATEQLEPGDAVLLHTDGVTEAHVPGGEEFGTERLADLVGQQASEGAQPEEVLRRVVHAVIEHQGQQLGDDATLVLVQWNGAA